MSGITRARDAPFAGDVVLLTGATGFVGMAVLARLLERTERHVYVLVRAGSQAEADARLAGVMGSLFDVPGRHRGRVEAVCGDLTAPGLGLGGERERIAEGVSKSSTRRRRSRSICRWGPRGRSTLRGRGGCSS